MQIFTDTNIDFMKMRKTALAISSVLLLVGIVSLILHGGPRYGIDFLGGVSLQLHFKSDIDVSEVRAALSNTEFKDATIKKFLGIEGAGTEILLYMKGSGSGITSSQSIDSVLTAAFQSKTPATTTSNPAGMAKPFEIVGRDMVGPKIGSELRDKAIWAILLSLLLILIYISWRFEFKFAVGAIVALFHDVVITLGVFSLLDLEISLAIVAAFLTIVGYSLNDTIVVFDRIRENLKKLRGQNYISIVNQSINQSLSRTVVTSFTTFVVVLILFLFGGENIRNFAFAMIAGIVVGTYSSIFVASPIVVGLHLQSEGKRSLNRSNREVKPQRAR
ncbi:protein translocase subunit SecF [candidate division KSB1 bacterium]|nr:protein translocase subunit SecF [candidate division KSB1 bacterium]